MQWKLYGVIFRMRGSEGRWPKFENQLHCPTGYYLITSLDLSFLLCKMGINYNAHMQYFQGITEKIQPNSLT